MDIGLQTFATPHRQITVLDAPGHKDFIPNMISGATQADCALLVVDASTGEFEAGFDRGGQTREHLVLVRSLGVSQVIVAVNKMDQVGISTVYCEALTDCPLQVAWSQDRFDEICESLKPFLSQTGFSNAKISYVPVHALMGINLLDRSASEAKALNDWYKGSTLVDLLGEPPSVQTFPPLDLCSLQTGLNPQAETSSVHSAFLYQTYSREHTVAMPSQGGYAAESSRSVSSCEPSLAMRRP